MLRSLFFVEVSLLPDERTAVSFVSVNLLLQVKVGFPLDRCLTRPCSCGLMDTLELDVDGIKTNDDDDTRHVAITVAPNPQLDILNRKRDLL